MLGSSWQPALREALAALALPPEEQVRRCGAGCIACDLLYDYDLARTAAMESSRLTNEGRRLLEEIDEVMESMSGADVECFSDAVLRRPAWNRLRQLAAVAQPFFGEKSQAVKPFVEAGPRKTCCHQRA